MTERRKVKTNPCPALWTDLNWMFDPLLAWRSFGWSNPQRRHHNEVSVPSVYDQTDCAQRFSRTPWTFSDRRIERVFYLSTKFNKCSPSWYIFLAPFLFVVSVFLFLCRTASTVESERKKRKIEHSKIAVGSDWKTPSVVLCTSEAGYHGLLLLEWNCQRIYSIDPTCSGDDHQDEKRQFSFVETISPKIVFWRIKRFSIYWNWGSLKWINSKEKSFRAIKIVDATRISPGIIVWQNSRHSWA